MIIIIVTKPPGSTSHVTQPADVGKVFKAIKSTIAGLSDDNLNDNDLKDKSMLEVLDLGFQVPKPPGRVHAHCDFKYHRIESTATSSHIYREIRSKHYYNTYISS